MRAFTVRATSANAGLAEVEAQPDATIANPATTETNQSLITPHFFGTSFMPHLGQTPGVFDVTSGCIGHTKVTPSAAGVGALSVAVGVSVDGMVAGMAPWSCAICSCSPDDSRFSLFGAAADAISGFMPSGAVGLAGSRRDCATGSGPALHALRSAPIVAILDVVAVALALGLFMLLPRGATYWLTQTPPWHYRRLSSS